MTPPASHSPEWKYRPATFDSFAVIEGGPRGELICMLPLGLLPQEQHRIGSMIARAPELAADRDAYRAALVELVDSQNSFVKICFNLQSDYPIETDTWELPIYKEAAARHLRAFAAVREIVAPHAPSALSPSEGQNNAGEAA